MTFWFLFNSSILEGSQSVQVQNACPGHLLQTVFQMSVSFQCLYSAILVCPLECNSGANLQPEQQPTHSSVCCVDYAVSCIVHLGSAQQFIHSFKESHFPVSFSNSHPVTSWDGVTCCLFAATQCSPAMVKSALSHSLYSASKLGECFLCLCQCRVGMVDRAPSHNLGQTHQQGAWVWLLSWCLSGVGQVKSNGFCPVWSPFSHSSGL